MTDMSPATTLIVTSGRKRGRKTLIWSKSGPFVLGVVGIIGFLLLWQLFSIFGPVSQHHFPPPTEVMPLLITNLALTSYWVAIGATLWAWFLGLLISTVGGVVLALLIGSSPVLRKYTHTTVEFLRPIPSVALIPLAALLFGPRIGSELLVIVYGCFWIVFIQVLYGMADVDKVANETVRTMGFTWGQRIRYLVFPTMLPYLITGIRLSATVALILAVSAELIIGTAGLGKSVAQAQLNDNPPAMFTLIITAGVLGIVVNFVFRFVEKRVLFWHPSVRAEAAV